MPAQAVPWLPVGLPSGVSLEAFPEVLANGYIITVKAALQAAEQRLQEQSEVLGQNHPTYQRTHAEVKNLRERLNAEANKIVAGLGNAVRIAVSRPEGSIYDARYLDTLKRLSDEVFLLPGVDRGGMRSLWTPSTRWVGVTEDGLEGGPVIPDGYDGSPASLQQLAANVARSGDSGQLVARDARASVIFVPLLSRTSDGKAIRIPLPALTEERRKELSKLVHKYAEEGRNGVRQARRDANDRLKKLLKESKISEDDERRSLDEVQKITDQHVAAIDDLQKKKDTELLGK